MAVYSKSGDAANLVYDSYGISKEQAFDIDGTPLIGFVTVMTYNVQLFMQLNAVDAMNNSFVNLYNPSIVAMQETPATLGDLMNDYYYKYNYRATDGYAGGCGMVSKFPIKSSECVDFVRAESLVADAVEPRFLHAVVDIDGVDLHIVNVHLALKQSTRASQASELLDFVSNKEYFVLLGDFNTNCTDDTQADYLTLVKPFVDVGYNVANNTNATGFTKTWADIVEASTTNDLKETCDNIIASSNINLEQVIFDTTKFDWAREYQQYIDHIAIVAKLKITTEDTP